MSQQSAVILERLLRTNGLGWMIEMFAPRDGALPHILKQLDGAAAEFRKRTDVNVSFSPETLEGEAARNPHKVRAFLQAISSASSPEMLVMVWRILQGSRIRQVAMQYQERSDFRLEVTLARPGENGDQLDSYVSADINDAALLRHFGISTIDGKPLFDGFYPLLLRDEQKRTA